MPARYWIIAFALGLTLTGLGGEQASSQNQQADNRAERANDSVQQADPFALPVQIIEDQEQSETRQRAEQYSRNLSERDLAAQEGMNKATKSIENATWLMLWASVVSTLFVAIGTGLLIWTLRLTRQANEAAQAAVNVTREIGERQVRAYLHLDDAMIEQTFDGVGLQVVISIKNSGQSPARNVVSSAKRYFGKVASDDIESVPWDGFEGIVDIGPQQSCSLNYEIPKNIVGRSAVDEYLVQLGMIQYRDVFKNDCSLKFAIQTEPGAKIGVGKLNIRQDGNYST